MNIIKQSRYDRSNRVEPRDCGGGGGRRFENGKNYWVESRLAGCHKETSPRNANDNNADNSGLVLTANMLQNGIYITASRGKVARRPIKKQKQRKTRESLVVEPPRSIRFSADCSATRIWDSCLAPDKGGVASYTKKLDAQQPRCRLSSYPSDSARKTMMDDDAAKNTGTQHPLLLMANFDCLRFN